MKKVLKWIGILLVGILGLIVIAGTGLAIYGSVNFKPAYSNRPLYEITADISPEGIARGKYLMEEAILCTEACHSEYGKTLAGGSETISEGPVSIVFAPSNLTMDQETGLGSWTDAEIARAIREGVDKDDVGLVIMPSYNYGALGDADVAAIVGYLRSVEPIFNEVPPVNGNIAAKILSALGMFGPDPVSEPITDLQLVPQPGTVENGRYMVSLGDCSACHKQNLAGGALPLSSPEDTPASNLTPGGELAYWDVEDFIAAVQEGQHPGGRILDEGMPRYGTTDEDLKDIFTYLLSLPALPMNE